MSQLVIKSGHLAMLHDPGPSPRPCLFSQHNFKLDIDRLLDAAVSDNTQTHTCRVKKKSVILISNMLLSVGTYLIASNIMFCGSILTAPTYIIIFKLASIFNGKSVFDCKIILLLVTRMGGPNFSS